MKQPTVGEVLRLLEELRRLGIKPHEYDLVSPWTRPIGRKTWRVRRDRTVEEGAGTR